MVSLGTVSQKLLVEGGDACFDAPFHFVIEIVIGGRGEDGLFGGRVLVHDEI